MTHPIDVGLAIAAGLLRALRPLLAHAIAFLLTLSGYRPPAPSRRPSEAPEPIAEPIALPAPSEPVLGTLEALKVSELRQLARQRGLSHLGRRGRRADLLSALA